MALRRKPSRSRSRMLDDASALLSMPGAGLGEGQLDAEVLGVETQRQQQQVRGLVVLCALLEPSGEPDQLLNILRER